jgi:NAD(P)-dependent dehydrogenase (short-subunit alcohol dehydrogenase family)
LATEFPRDQWAVILGGSSGFGLATAQQLAAHGLKICIVHRDRRGAMADIEPEFEKIRKSGVELRTFNADALSADVRAEILDELGKEMGGEGKVRVLMHSIAFGNLKLIAPEHPANNDARAALAVKLGISEEDLAGAVDELFDEGVAAMSGLATAPKYAESYMEEEDLARTIHAMGTSMLSWTQDVRTRGLFAADARVFGLTSEGNTVAWKGYAGVAAAKVALESVSRSIATEMGPFGIRSNIIQAGVTDTPALRLIPGNAFLKAQAVTRNPMGRLTTPKDVASVIYLLSTDEAGWINGELIRVDGGEHISGATR